MNSTSQPAKEHFSKLYREVSDGVGATSEDIAALRINHQDGRREIGGVLEKLRAIQSSFDSELDLLANQAEWEKFTLAFFGETNAGKSTIIESLRILFREESRQELLARNEHNLARYEQAVNEQVQRVQGGLRLACESHAKALFEIRQHVDRIKDIAKEESGARVRRRLWLAGVGGMLLGSALAALAFLLIK